MKLSNQIPTAILGSAWGDECKGNLTDHFADDDTLVVRHNGGAQAGHTVVRDGVRHVFHHFGSGTLRGAVTLLSRFFINNPILYFKELNELRALGVEPVVYVDPDGLVTTPWDMMINTLLEESRGTSRHGSCGVGINETIKRSEHSYYKLTITDLIGKYYIKPICEAIIYGWVPKRLEQLGLDPSPEWMDRLHSKSIMETYIEHCIEYVKATCSTLIGNKALWSVMELTDRKKIVFEGAQGLLLDEDHYFFPHVTHSHTGLKNVMTLATEAGIDEMDVIYATRAYATRHGAGPFPREQIGLRYEDATNVPNDWQGSLRFGHLDLDLLAESITNDMRQATIPVRLGLAITCLDQVGDIIAFWNDGDLRGRSPMSLADTAFNKINASIRLGSFGPTAMDIRNMEVVLA